MVIQIEVIVDDGDNHGLLNVVVAIGHVVVQQAAGGFNVALAV